MPLLTINQPLGLNLGNNPEQAIAQTKLKQPHRTETKPEIIEAQGLIINDRGILELVAHQTDPNSSPPQPEVKICKQ